MFSIWINGIFWQVVYLVFSKIDISKTTGLDRTLWNFFLVIFYRTFLRVFFTFLSLEGFLMLSAFETKLVSIMIKLLLKWFVDGFRIISKSISGDVRQAVKMVFSKLIKVKQQDFIAPCWTWYSSAAPSLARLLQLPLEGDILMIIGDNHVYKNQISFPIMIRFSLKGMLMFLECFR